MKQAYFYFNVIVFFLLISSRALGAAGDSPCTATVFESCTAIGSLTYTLSSVSNWTSAGNGITDPASTCLGTGSKDANYWFSYTATQDDQSIVFNFTKPGGSGSIGDCSIQVYSASSCSSTFTSIACQNNGSDGNANTSSITVTPGTTYYVRLFEASGNGLGDSFQASIAITKNTSIGQTPCTARTILSLPYTYSSNTLCNGNLIAANCAGKTAGASGTGEDYYFKYTSPGNEYISISLTGLNPAITQGIVISNPVASCSDAKICYSDVSFNGTFAGGIAGVAGTSSSLCRTVYLSSAGDYYLIMDASSSRGGSFTLSVSSYTPVSTSDACSWAQGVTPLAASYTIDNCSSTTDHVPVEAGNPISAAAGASGCGYTSENTKWFTIVADDPAPSQIVVTLSGVGCSYPDNGSTAGIQMGVFTGTCGGTWTKVGSCVNSASATVSQTITSPPAGQRYYIVVDGNAGSICSFGIAATNVVPLPITLLSFDARYNGKGVDIDWHTAAEVDNDHFEIERSYDGEIFEVIGLVQAHGSGSQPNDYHWQDNDVHEGIVYYRLKQTDINGTSAYTGIRAVEIPRIKQLLAINVLQEGGATELLVTGLEEDAVVLLTDAMGKLVQKTMISGSEERIRLEESSAAGIYFVTVMSGDQMVRTKFLKAGFQ